MINQNRDVLFALIKAGLWADAKSTNSGWQGFIEPAVWDRVYQLAAEQSIIGVTLAGIEQSNIRPPQELLLQWIGDVQMLEQQNKAMNLFIAYLVDSMRNIGIYTLLLKGQGIAQCYERPLWRASGDVDLFLSDENYKKALSFLTPLAAQIEMGNRHTKHIGMTIDQWEVELHGTLRSELWQRLDEVLDGVQYDIFCGGNVRSWLNGHCQVFQPSADEDVVYVFAHILQHFYKGGIGLRQVCDWCRLLWTFRGKINLKLLEERLRSMGVMAEWKTFAALAVNIIGMPVEAIPFYEASIKWKKKAQKVLDYILETGNFGHNRDMSFRNENSALKRKTLTFWFITSDSIKHFSIFPSNSLKVWWSQMKIGLLSLVGK